MSLKYADLRNLSDEELIEQHDQKAQHTIVGINYYLTELNHRVIARQTITMKRLTWLITLLTATNVVFVALSVFNS